MALIQTPHRFRRKRQLWTYSGLPIDTCDSAQYRYVAGQLQRAKKPQQLRELNENHNHDMKAIFKSVATMASSREGAFRDFYQGLLGKGMKQAMAQLTLARMVVPAATQNSTELNSLLHIAGTEGIRLRMDVG